MRHGLLTLWVVVLGLWCARAAAQPTSCRQPEWVRAALGPHQGPSVVFHPGLGKVLRLDPTAWEWTWDGWSRMARPFGADAVLDPPGAMAWDPVREEVVALGVNSGVTRIWRDGAWRYVQSSPTPSRREFTLAFDPNLQRVVMVGGVGASGNPRVVHGDMWAWDGAAWSLINQGALPARYGHTMGVDPLSGRLMVQGGRASWQGEPRGETWAWNGKAWSLVSSAGPVQSTTGVMYEDADAGRLRLLHTRTDAGPGHLWEWEGAAWDSVGEIDMAGRTNSGVAYDPVRRVLVVSGGAGSPRPLSETWEYDGQTWVRAWQSAVPDAPWGMALAYDEARDRMIAFGGGDPTRQMLALDGDRWFAVDSTGPSARNSVAMAYDQARRVIVMHGGTSLAGPAVNDTWEWDGSTWTQRATDGPAATGQCMAYDSNGQRMLLVDAARRLWSWDGLQWAMLGTDAPVGGQATVAFDPVRRVLVANPGSANSTIAEWDGTFWRVLNPLGGTGVGFHGGAAMAFDGSVQRIAMSGGWVTLFPEPSQTNWVWEYDGQRLIVTWAGEPGTPQPMIGHTMAWDSKRQRSIVLREQTWSIERQGATPPGIIGHPMSQTVAVGSTIRLAVQTTQMPFETYQWRYNGEPMNGSPGQPIHFFGAQSRVLEMPGATVSMSGEFDCVVSTVCGDAVSNPATVVVRCNADLTAGAIAGQAGYGVPDGLRTNDDFFYYIAAYGRGDLGVADVTRVGASFPGLPGFGVPDGVLGTEDFFAFYYYLTSAPC